MGLDIFPSAFMGMNPGVIPNIPVPKDVPVQHLRQQMMLMRATGMLGHGMGRMGGGYRQGAPGGLDLSTGADPSTMDWDKANELLGQFGQHMPENPSPYAMLPNSGFFGAHQRLGGALEGALFGAANTGPANTLGEGISNVARGILGGTAERQRAVNQQFQQPFMSASMMGQLMQQKQTLDMQAAHEQLYEAQAHKDLAAPIPKFSHFFQDYNPQSPTYGQPFGVRPTGEAEAIPLPAGVNVNKPTGGATKPWGGMLTPSQYSIAGALNIPHDRPPTTEEFDAINRKSFGQNLALRKAGAQVSSEGADDRGEVERKFRATMERYKSEWIPPNTQPSELYQRFGREGLQAGYIEKYNKDLNDKYGLPNEYTPGKVTKDANGPSTTTRPKTPMPNKPAATWNPVTKRWE